MNKCYKVNGSSSEPILVKGCHLNMLMVCCHGWLYLFTYFIFHTSLPFALICLLLLKNQTLILIEESVSEEGSTYRSI